MNKNRLYRSIPKVDVLLEDEQIQFLICKYGRECVVREIRTELEELRIFIGECENEQDAEERLVSALKNITNRVIGLYKPHMKNVINATGTILHTNLGRAPLSEAHVAKIMGMISGYSNLEYNLEAGKRGERYAHFEELLCKITGAEAAMAVNNNAASVLLVLRALAQDGEVIVSRGELVEVGGSFRIPEVMKLSGANLIEVGATNKTHLEDYENAITEETKVLMKVHTSNYKIVGFSESVEIKELLPVAKKYNIPLIEDLGSGVLIDLEKYGLAHEPTVQEKILAGTDVVCFSGDKLLGGPQAGIIVGKKKYIDKIKKNQLARALRIDKFTAAALELVLMEYLSEENAIKNIPVLRMITRPLCEIEKDAQEFCAVLKKKAFPAKIQCIHSESKVGGGSLPMEVIPSMAVAIIPERIRVSEFEKRMRKLSVPVIGRIVDQQYYLDVRTMEKKHFEMITDMFEETKIFHKNCSIF